MIPQTYRDLCLDSAHPDATVMERVRTWFAGTRERGLYLFGPPGAGKTRTACAILNECQRSGQSGTFAHIHRDVLEPLRTAIGRKTADNAQSLQTRLAETPVLVLDGFGEHRDTNWTWLVLYDILDARICAGRITIVTSREFPDAWAGRFANRIYSRLCEHVEPVLVDHPQTMPRMPGQRFILARSPARRMLT